MNYSSAISSHQSHGFKKSARISIQKQYGGCIQQLCKVLKKINKILVCSAGNSFYGLLFAAEDTW